MFGEKHWPRNLKEVVGNSKLIFKCKFDYKLISYIFYFYRIKLNFQSIKLT